jgi:hypothetical protein
LVDKGSGVSAHCYISGDNPLACPPEAEEDHQEKKGCETKNNRTEKKDRDEKKSREKKNGEQEKETRTASQKAALTSTSSNLFSRVPLRAKSLPGIRL